MTAELEYADHVALLGQTDPRLAGEAAAFTGIRSVLSWMQQRGLTKARIDIVGQDEFHYDFLVELAPGGRWAAFGVT